MKNDAGVFTPVYNERDHWKFKDRDETKNRNFAFVLVTFLL